MNEACEAFCNVSNAKIVSAPNTVDDIVKGNDVIECKVERKSRLFLPIISTLSACCSKTMKEPQTCLNSFGRRSL